jgi:predicted kinase
VSSIGSGLALASGDGDILDRGVASRRPVTDRPPLELAILIGLQGAGKSTFVRERLAATHLVVATDAFPRRARKAERELREVEQALTAGRSVVADATHAARSSRAPLLALGARLGATVVGYSLASDYDACLARNAARDGLARVPDVALRDTFARLQRPRLDEGFAALWHVAIGPEGFVVSPWTEEVADGRA